MSNMTPEREAQIITQLTILDIKAKIAVADMEQVRLKKYQLMVELQQLITSLPKDSTNE